MDVCAKRLMEISSVFEETRSDHKGVSDDYCFDVLRITDNTYKKVY